MPAPKELLALVQRFQDNRGAYRAPGYKEAQLRQEFLDPFLGLLGWDVENVQGYAEAYKEVIHEDSPASGSRSIFAEYAGCPECMAPRRAR